MPPGALAGRRAHGRLRRALLLRARARRADGHGRLPRYTWRDAYAELREKLDALALGPRSDSGAKRPPTACSSTRTSTSTARRPRAAASASTARTRCSSPSATARGSCSARSSPTRSSSRRRRSTSTAARAACASTRARPVRSTSRARSTRRAASRTGRRRRRRSRSRTAPRSARRCTAATSARTSAPGTAGSRSAGAAWPPDGEPHVSLVDWLREDGDALRDRYRRLYVPRNDVAMAAPQRARRGGQCRWRGGADGRGGVSVRCR